MYNNELYHYGVPGMRWGIRRSEAQLARAAARRADKQRKKEMRRDVKNRRLLSDEDLKRKVSRLEMEKKLRTLTDEEINRGRKAVSKALSGGGKILVDSGKQVATSAIAGAAKYGVRVKMTGEKANLKDAADYIVPKPKKK